MKQVFFGSLGKLDEPEQFNEFIKNIDDFKVTVERTKHIRTDQQNKALHLWFTLLAVELNNAGFDMRKLIREGIDIPWSKDTVKEYLWRPVQKVMFGKKSTTQLETHELDKIWETLNRHIGERTGIHVPFPSEDDLSLGWFVD